jgi:hypothetical protein
VTQPDGIPARDAAGAPSRSWREVARSLRPWKRRIIGLLVAWVAIAGVTVAFGTSPNVPVLLVVLVTLAMLLWHVVDHAEDNHLKVWPLVDGEIGGRGRGNDFRVTNLAGRLAAANEAKEGRETLVHDLHVQLQELIRERLYARHGLLAEEEPRWAEAVTPPQLWELLVGLPPPDLYRPDRLGPILTSIEEW